MNPGLLLALYVYKRSSVKDIIDEDIAHWKEILKLEGTHKELLIYLLRVKPEFRNLFYYRIGGIRIISRLMKIFLPPLSSLYIWTQDIGGGLFIQHGFATVIAANKMGKHCFVNQQVTIGYKGDKAPVIGDNVTVTCGAKILGGISIGNNVTVGANSVVVKDVPPDVTVAGIPSKIIRYKENRQ